MTPDSYTFTGDTVTVLGLNQKDIRTLLRLIEFHDDWDEVSEIVGTDVALLHAKVAALRTY